MKVAVAPLDATPGSAMTRFKPATTHSLQSASTHTFHLLTRSTRVCCVCRTNGPCATPRTQGSGPRGATPLGSATGRAGAGGGYRNDAANNTGELSAQAVACWQSVLHCCSPSPPHLRVGGCPASTPSRSSPAQPVICAQARTACRSTGCILTASARSCASLAPRAGALSAFSPTARRSCARWTPPCLQLSCAGESMRCILDAAALCDVYSQLSARASFLLQPAAASRTQNRTSLIAPTTTNARRTGASLKFGRAQRAAAADAASGSPSSTSSSSSSRLVKRSAGGSRAPAAASVVGGPATAALGHVAGSMMTGGAWGSGPTTTSSTSSLLNGAAAAGMIMGHHHQHRHPLLAGPAHMIPGLDPSDVLAVLPSDPWGNQHHHHQQAAGGAPVLPTTALLSVDFRGQQPTLYLQPQHQQQQQHRHFQQSACSIGEGHHPHTSNNPELSGYRLLVPPGPSALGVGREAGAGAGTFLNLLSLAISQPFTDALSK